MAEDDTLDALEEIPTGNLSALRDALLTLRVHEIVALLGRSDSRRRAVLFRLLPKDRALAVFEALEPALGAHEGRLEDADHGDLAERGPARVQQVEHEEVGDHVDADGGVGQLRDELVDARLGPQRQAHVDEVEVTQRGACDAWRRAS